MHLLSYDSGTRIVFTQGNYTSYFSAFIVSGCKYLFKDTHSVLTEIENIDEFTEFAQLADMGHGENGLYHMQADASLFVRPRDHSDNFSIKSESGETVSRLIVSLCPWGTAGSHITANGGFRPWPVNGVDYINRKWDFANVDGRETLRLCNYFTYLDSKNARRVSATWYEYFLTISTGTAGVTFTYRKTYGQDYAEERFNLTTVPPSNVVFNNWVTSSNRRGWFIQSAPTDIRPELIIKKAQNAMRWIRGVCQTATPRSVLDDLSMEVVQQARVIDSNLYTLIPELVNLPKASVDAATLLASTATNPSLRKLASLELSSKYGIQLTVKDVMSIHERWSKLHKDPSNLKTARSIHRRSDQVSVPGGGTANLSKYTAVKVWYRSMAKSPFHNAVWSMFNHGVYPSVENSWDMVPYSFCLDWFIDVSRTCRQLDSGVLATLLPVELVLYGFKTIGEVSVRSIPDLSWYVSGTMSFSEYRRRSGHLYNPQPTLQAASSPFNNYVEAGAIVTQLATKR